MLITWKAAFKLFFFLEMCQSSWNSLSKIPFKKTHFFFLADEDYLSYFGVEQQSQWVIKLETGVKLLSHQRSDFWSLEFWISGKLLTLECLSFV